MFNWPVQEMWFFHYRCHLFYIHKYIVYLASRFGNKSYILVVFHCFRCGIIPILADILADAQKEKVSRIILAVFRVSLTSIYFPHLNN